jgi:hypothetical protein
MTERHVFAEGTGYNPYTNPLESTNLTIDLQAQEIPMQKDRKYTLHDIYYFEKRPFCELYFKNAEKIVRYHNGY